MNRLLVRISIRTTSNWVITREWISNQRQTKFQDHLVLKWWWSGPYWWILPNIQIIPMLFIVFQKIGDKVTLPNLLYKASITLPLKSEQDSRRKLQVNIPDKNGCKNSQQNINKLNSVIPWKDPILGSSGIYSQVIKNFQHLQINQW